MDDGGLEMENSNYTRMVRRLHLFTCFTCMRKQVIGSERMTCLRTAEQVCFARFGSNIDLI